MTNRLVEAVSGISRGDSALSGRSGRTSINRSLTSWRAVSTFVPSSKIAVTTHRPGTDDDRSVLSRLTPPRALSTGSATSCSTSSVDNPGASVCTTICGGANSGKTSHLAVRRHTAPATSTATASPTTTNGNRNENRISARIILNRRPQR